jgi:hypothetical protein
MLDSDPQFLYVCRGEWWGGGGVVTWLLTFQIEMWKLYMYSYTVRMHTANRHLSSRSPWGWVEPHIAQQFITTMPSPPRSPTTTPTYSQFTPSQPHPSPTSLLVSSRRQRWPSLITSGPHLRTVIVIHLVQVITWSSVVFSRKRIINGKLQA